MAPSTSTANIQGSSLVYGKTVQLNNWQYEWTALVDGRNISCTVGRFLARTVTKTELA